MSAYMFQRMANVDINTYSSMVTATLFTMAKT